MTVFLRIAAAIVLGLSVAGGAFASSPTKVVLQAAEYSESNATANASASSSTIQESELISASFDELATDETSAGTS
jgi:hypothetical protein